MKLDNNKRTSAFLAGLILLGLLVPLGLYWLAFGRAATIMPIDARAMLTGGSGDALLVDIRSAEVYRRKHIDGAEHWPLDDILSTRSPEDIPAAMQGKKLLLICEMGSKTVTAALHLSDIGAGEVYSVRGGLQAWTGHAAGGGKYQSWRTADGGIEPLAFHNATQLEQFLTVASGYGFKTTYSLLAFVLVCVLWRSKAPDLAALRWAMIFFFIGENCCTINYLVFGETSYLFEMLHSYGMLLCFGFTTYAIIEGFDTRLIRLSDPEGKCAALSLCDKCIKYAEVPCGLRRVFYLIIAAMMIVSGMLMTADIHEVSYNVEIYGAAYHYANPLVHQLYEIVFCPAAAIAMFGVSLVMLLRSKGGDIRAAKMTFAAGFGALGFGSLRMILAGAYSRRMVYFVFWEEATELLFVAGVCCVLWVFRRRLFPKTTQEA
jgi:rhodanese-related sulfurtransferase